MNKNIKGYIGLVGTLITVTILMIRGWYAGMFTLKAAFSFEIPWNFFVENLILYIFIALFYTLMGMES